MAKGKLYINGKDAYQTWGITFSDTTISALLTPPPAKEYISNSSRLSNGKNISVSNSKFADRDISLPFNMTANNRDEFLKNYADFCENVLANGKIVLHTSYLPNVWFKCVYVSCSQYSTFFCEIAQFTLKLNEPNPADRTNPNDNS